MIFFCKICLSLEFKVKEVMHKAFWDALRAKLDDAPPDYRFALNLLTEVKQVCFVSLRMTSLYCGFRIFLSFYLMLWF